eukprot:TRINITY_DN2080_c1_g1_i1.p1 TRINITY_DN2080_c1_g1~~TRINITY_DN2080_c1_g1_i1.p1  ORF type:complete len:394 (-),score=24.40 TRINITY_DN2080_c1_g1_i1:128-1309(-)
MILLAIYFGLSQWTTLIAVASEYECVGNQEIILGNTPVVLKSVGYPKSYKGLINCSFDMISSPNENITLSCSEFHVTGIGPKCIFGGLEVNMGSGGEEPEVICVPGYGHSKLKLSRRNKLRLRFYNKYFQNKGFYCQVQKVREPFKCRCGTKNVNRRIVGGKEVEENEYPWHIGITKIGSNRPFCGGALITDRHIATAGHCFNSINEVEVIIGEHNIKLNNDTTERFSVAKIEVHKLFNVGAMNDYDITILTLDHPVKFRREIQPVCLPFKDEDFVGTICTITGWGRLSEVGPQPAILNEVDVPVITNAICKKSYDELTSRMICAGYDEGKLDACQGDSGGPLACPQNKRMVLAGATSFGFGCARPGYPGVYTRISKVQDWIEERIADGNKCD